MAKPRTVFTEGESIKPIPYLLLEYSDGILSPVRRVYNLDQPLHFEISTAGIKFVRVEDMCKLCGGGGGHRLWFAQDDVHFVRCYICGGGTKDEWDRMHKAFNEMRY